MCIRDSINAEYGEIAGRRMEPDRDEEVALVDPSEARLAPVAREPVGPQSAEEAYVLFGTLLDPPRLVVFGHHYPVTELGDTPVILCGCLSILVTALVLARVYASWSLFEGLALGLLLVSVVGSYYLNDRLKQPRPDMSDMADHEHTYACPLGPPLPSNPTAFFDIEIAGEPVGRIEFEVRVSDAPLTARNFLGLCVGHRGHGYKGTVFHHVVRGLRIHGGDTEHRCGGGGHSIYGRPFDDENFDLRHDGPGVLSMANNGPHTNKSQFCLSVRAQHEADGLQCVFGQVVRGFDVVKAIESVGSAWNPFGFTYHEVLVVECGVLGGEQEDQPAEEEEEEALEFRAQEQEADVEEGCVQEDEECAAQDLMLEETPEREETVDETLVKVDAGVHVDKQNLDVTAPTASDFVEF
eukprot:TRINITY_DN11699_c0_g1_i1.p1 TRINITY_DN11699_c0_g1~~TRINITY_DN11699_c0_g1_i1.p1  ORF type:complete len:410 (-),score=86.05 TRINITY_DN11699_c0_g1_i1:157-1386(-)